jgi:hypothetical protein
MVQEVVAWLHGRNVDLDVRKSKSEQRNHQKRERIASRLLL